MAYQRQQPQDPAPRPRAVDARALSFFSWIVGFAILGLVAGVARSAVARAGQSA